MPDLPPLLDIRELSKYLGVPASTIYAWRSRGVGPRAYRFGEHLKFAVTDVTEWIEAQRDPAPPATVIGTGCAAGAGERRYSGGRDVLIESDIDLSVPSVRITGAIVSTKGEPAVRQGHPKTARSRRTIHLPVFAAQAVQHPSL